MCLPLKQFVFGAPMDHPAMDILDHFSWQIFFPHDKLILITTDFSKKWTERYFIHKQEAATVAENLSVVLRFLRRLYTMFSIPILSLTWWSKVIDINWNASRKLRIGTCNFNHGWCHSDAWARNWGTIRHRGYHVRRISINNKTYALALATVAC